MKARLDLKVINCARKEVPSSKDDGEATIEVTTSLSAEAIVEVDGRHLGSKKFPIHVKGANLVPQRPKAAAEALWQALKDSALKDWLPRMQGTKEPAIWSIEISQPEDPKSEGIVDSPAWRMCMQMAATIPWETLATEPCALPNVEVQSVIRKVPAVNMTQKKVSTDLIKVLVAISNPEDAQSYVSGAVPWSASELDTKLRMHMDTATLQIDSMPAGWGPPELKARLSSDSYACLVLVAHGGVDPSDEEDTEPPRSWLLFQKPIDDSSAEEMEHDTGLPQKMRSKTVTAPELIESFGQDTFPPLVLLGCCHSFEPFLGPNSFAGYLVAHSSAEVALGMCGTVEVDAALYFMGRFVRAMIEGVKGTKGCAAPAATYARQEMTEEGKWPHQAALPVLVTNISGDLRIWGEEGFGVAPHLPVGNSLVADLRAAQLDDHEYRPIPVLGPEMNSGIIFSDLRTIAEQFAGANYPLQGWPRSTMASTTDYRRRSLGKNSVEDMLRTNPTMRAMVGWDLLPAAAALTSNDVYPYYWVARLKSTFFVNTNRDPLLYIALQKAEKRPKVVYVAPGNGADWKTLAKCLKAATEKEPVIWHPFGWFPGAIPKEARPNGHEPEMEIYMCEFQLYLWLLRQESKSGGSDSQIMKQFGQSPLIFLGFTLENLEFKILLAFLRERIFTTGRKDNSGIRRVHATRFNSAHYTDPTEATQYLSRIFCGSFRPYVNENALIQQVCSLKSFLSSLV